MFWPVLCMFDVWLMLFFGRLKFWVVQLSRTLSDSEWTFDFGTSDTPLVCSISAYLLMSVCLFPAGWQKLRLFWRDIWLIGDFELARFCAQRKVSRKSGVAPSPRFCWEPVRGWRPFILWLNIFVTVAFYINFLLIIITVAFYINKFKVNKFGL